MKLLKTLSLWAVLWLPGTGSCQVPLPAVHGETAAGRPIELPAASAGKVTLLLLGFTKQAGDRTAPWEDRASKDFGGEARVAIYAIAELESVPGLVRGMVKSGIRSGTPAGKKDRTVMTFAGQAALKKLCGVTDDKIPYLLLLDPGGNIVWKGQGLFDAGSYENARKAVEAALAKAR